MQYVDLTYLSKSKIKCDFLGRDMIGKLTAR